MTAAEHLVEAKGGRIARLAVAGAFHTALMKPADERLAEAIANARWDTPRIPVWSNVDAKPHTDPTEIREPACAAGRFPCALGRDNARIVG